MPVTVNDLIDLSSCYQDHPLGKERREFLRPWEEGNPALRKSLTHCHDVTRKVIKANMQLQAMMLKFDKRDTIKTIMLWVSGGLNVGLWAVLLIFGEKLLGCITR